MSTTVETPTSSPRRDGRTTDHRPRRSRRRHRGWIWWVVGLVVAGAIGVFIYLSMADKDETGAGDQSQDSQSSSTGEVGAKSRGGTNKAALKVRVVRPHRGGIARISTQLAEIRFFAHIQMYAKVSGFLRAQVVDIGDTVRLGDVLAEVYAPELEQQVLEAAAAVEQARAEIVQAEAMVTVDEAAIRAGTAVVKEQEARVGQYTATRKYREKMYVRYVELATSRAIDERAADEKQEDFESAKAGEQVAVAAVESSRGNLARAVAQVEKAKADVKTARARLVLVEAREATARIYQQYTRLTAPFDGVVTDRNYYSGDFIRDAAQGVNSTPVLSLARTDLMRVVVYIPDTQVAYVDRGDEAVVRVTALGGEEFRGKVARYSNMELASNRAMRVEIDLPNPSGRLRHGMYGDVTILLEPAPNVLSIPSPGLIENDGHGAGAVYLVKDRKARKVKVRVGKDDGLIAEMLSGLSADDEVIVDYSGSIEDGSDVTPLPATVEQAKREAGGQK